MQLIGRKKKVLEALEDLTRLQVKIKNAKARIANKSNILVELHVQSYCPITLNSSYIIGDTCAKHVNTQMDEETIVLALKTYIKSCSMI